MSHFLKVIGLICRPVFHKRERVAFGGKELSVPLQDTSANFCIYWHNGKKTSGQSQ